MKSRKQLSEKLKKEYPSPNMLLSLAEKASSIQEYRKYENMLFDAMELFAHDKDEKGDEIYSFYPTFAYALMSHCLAGKCAFATEFDYKRFFDSLLASDNKCNIGEAVYLYRYLSYGNTLSRDELKEQEKESFEQRKKQFFEAFNKSAFLDKCDKLGLVGPACIEEDYAFLAFSAGKVLGKENN